MSGNVFPIIGNKVRTLYFGDNSLRLFSQSVGLSEEFIASWDKKLSLATKTEVRFSAMKSIRKEDKDDKFFVIFKTVLGIPSELEFSFVNKADTLLFLELLEKEQYFTLSTGQLTPFKAIQRYLLGLAFALVVTIFAYYQAVAIANGTVEETTSGKTKLFNGIVGVLGTKGVLVIGGLACCFIIYKIWTRFRNPPHQTRLLPPNR